MDDSINTDGIEMRIRRLEVRYMILMLVNALLFILLIGIYFSQRHSFEHIKMIDDSSVPMISMSSGEYRAQIVVAERTANMGIAGKGGGLAIAVYDTGPSLRFYRAGDTQWNEVPF